MKFAVLAAAVCSSLCLLTGCGTATRTTFGPVDQSVIRQLDEAALGKRELIEALNQRGIRPTRNAPQGEVRLPMQLSNSVPVIKCRINGRSVGMIFDTGASHSMLNAADAVRLEVLTLKADAAAIPMIGVMGVEQGRLGVIESIEIGAWRVTGYPCLIRTQQNAIEGRTLRRVFQPNLLGFDLAAQAASYLILDYRRGEIIYGFGQPFQPPRGPRAASSPFKMDNGVPSTRLRIGSQEWDALIDSGSFNGVEVGVDLARRLGIYDGSKPVHGLSVFGVGGSMTSTEAGLRVAKVDELHAAGLPHRDAQIDIAPGPPRLGSFFLKDYRVSFDLRNRKMWLEW